MDEYDDLYHGTIITTVLTHTNPPTHPFHSTSTSPIPPPAPPAPVLAGALKVFLLGEDTRNNYFIVLPDFAPAVPLWWFRLISHIFGHIR
jgi:hypothetical protein